MWTARLNVRERYLIPHAHTHAYSCTQKPYTDKTPCTDSVWSVRLNVRGWCKFTRLLPEVVHHNANAGQISVSLSSKNFAKQDSVAPARAANHVCVNVGGDGVQYMKPTISLNPEFHQGWSTFLRNIVHCINSPRKKNSTRYIHISFKCLYYTSQAQTDTRIGCIKQCHMWIWKSIWITLKSEIEKCAIF